MKNKTTFSFLKAGLVAVALSIIAIPTLASADLSLLLKYGSRGTEVSALQTFLARDNTIYPQGLVTGYFGSLTKSAVSNFQARNGLSHDGIVGPMTRAVINQQMGGVVLTGGAPTISNVYTTSSRNSVSVNWNTNELAKGVVYYSINPLSTYEYENSVDVSGTTAMTDSSARTLQNVSIQNLQAGTTYYYLIYTTDQAGMVSVTWPTTFTTTN